MKTMKSRWSLGLGLVLFLASAGPGWCVGWSDWSADPTTSMGPFLVWTDHYTWAYGADGATVTPEIWTPAPSLGPWLWHPFGHDVAANDFTLGAAGYELPGTVECKILMPNHSACFTMEWLQTDVAGHHAAVRYRTYNVSGVIVDDGIYCPLNSQTFAAMGCPASIATANPVTLFYTITSDLKFIVGARKNAGEIWLSSPITPAAALSVGQIGTIYSSKGWDGSPASATAVDATVSSEVVLKILAVRSYAGMPPAAGWASWSNDCKTSATLDPGWYPHMGDMYDVFANAYAYTFPGDGATLTPIAGHAWPAAANPIAHQANTIPLNGAAPYTLPATFECRVRIPDNVSVCYDWGWLNAGVAYYSNVIRYRNYNASGQIVDDGIYSQNDGQTFAAKGCPAAIYTANPVTIFYTITTDLKFIVGARTDAGQMWSSSPVTPASALGATGGPSTVYAGKGFRGTPADASAVDATNGSLAVLKLLGVQVYGGLAVPVELSEFAVE